MGGNENPNSFSRLEALIKKIREEFFRIKGLGFLMNVKEDSNDGGAGNTFESHLGVQENNKKDPDFEDFEVKTKKYLKSKTPISLFTLRPTFPNDGDNYMRRTWGVPDANYKEVLCFRTTLRANRWSVVYKSYKFKVDVDRKKERVYLVKADLNENILDRTVYWSFEDIQNGTKKLQNLFLVDALVKEVDQKQHFHYINATAFVDYLGNVDFIELLEQGLISYDNRLGVHGPGTPLEGKPHNHGGGFRISKKHIDKLYRLRIDI
jgi:hypothetical protein